PVRRGAARAPRRQRRRARRASSRQLDVRAARGHGAWTAPRRSWTRPRSRPTSGPLFPRRRPLPLSPSCRSDCERGCPRSRTARLEMAASAPSILPRAMTRTLRPTLAASLWSVVVGLFSVLLLGVGVISVVGPGAQLLRALVAGSLGLYGLVHIL